MVIYGSCSSRSLIPLCSLASWPYYISYFALQSLPVAELLGETVCSSGTETKSDPELQLPWGTVVAQADTENNVILNGNFSEIVILWNVSIFWFFIPNWDKSKYQYMGISHGMEMPFSNQLQVLFLHHPCTEQKSTFGFAESSYISIFFQVHLL